MRVDVRYIDEGRAADRLTIHPIDEIKAKRDLAGKAWADEDTVLYYRTFYAAKRAGAAEAQADFDSWLEKVSEVEPHLSRKMVETAILAGTINEEQAEALYAQISKEEQAEGESPAPPS